MRAHLLLTLCLCVATAFAQDCTISAALGSTTVVPIAGAKTLRFKGVAPRIKFVAAPSGATRPTILPPLLANLIVVVIDIVVPFHASYDAHTFCLPPPPRSPPPRNPFWVFRMSDRAVFPPRSSSPTFPNLPVNARLLGNRDS